MPNNEGKSVVTERFIRTLKNKIYKYMASILKNVHIDTLDNIINKCNNTYHSTIKPKPVHLNLLESTTSVNFRVENNDKDFKFKVADHKTLPKYKNIFCKRLHSKLV